MRAGGHGVAGGEQEAEVRGGGGGLVVVGEEAAVVPIPAQGAALLQPRHPRHGGQEAGPRHPALQPGAGAGHGGGEAGWRHQGEEDCREIAAHVVSVEHRKCMHTLCTHLDYKS